MLTHIERLKMLDWGYRELPVTKQAKLFGLNRSGLYSKPKSLAEEGLAHKQAIDEIYTEHPRYGSRRIVAELRRPT